MSDFDTRRVSEITSLEEKINVLQNQVQYYKAIAEKWEPRVHVESHGVDDYKVTLVFGGKVTSGVMSSAQLALADPTSTTTSVLETFCQTLVKDQLRPIVTPEIQKAISNVVSLAGVSKW